MIEYETAKLKLCNHCLGRIYAMLGHGLSNEERGRAIRVVYAMLNNINVESLYPEKCELCGGIFERVEDYANYIANLLKNYEFTTFLLGSKFSNETIEKEKELQEKYGNSGEDIGREFNREVGKKVSEITGKEVNFNEPEIVVIIDTRYDDIKLEIKPLFIYGRYRKLIRGIPQTKWPSGKYKESVEDIIAKVVMEKTEGEGHSLHGLGREDIDARMLGNGRPFIFEIKRPKKRFLNLEEIEREINEFARGKIEVSNLRYSNHSEVVKIKNAVVKKRYRVGIRVDENEENMNEKIKSLIGKIRQRTPKRVVHRRSDRIRIREVYDAKIISHHDNFWEIEILAESGTYIKELMHGDDGRTKPSLSEKLGKEVKVEYLDVVEILDNF